MIDVDSSVWIDYFNGTVNREVEYLDTILGVVPVAIGDIISAEVLQGFRDDKDYRQAKALLYDLTFAEMPGYSRAVSSANRYRKLRRQGITIRKTNDVIIGSFCIDERVPLLFSDRGFQNLVERSDLSSAIESAFTELPYGVSWPGIAGHR